MNSEAEDDHIRKVFSRMRESDSQRAPSFEKQWRSARSQVGRSDGFRHYPKFAFAGLVLLAIAGSLFIYRLDHTAARNDRRTKIADLSDKGQRASGDEPRVESPKTGPGQAPDLRGLPFVKPPESSRRTLEYYGRLTRASRVNMHQSGGRIVQRPLLISRGESLISDWRSPTDFLLKTGNDRLFSTYPNLDDSIVRLDIGPLDAR